MESFPRSPGEITVEWLRNILREDVTGVELLPTPPGYGAVGSYARLNLRYSTPQPRAPQSLFAKLSADQEPQRARTHKGGFYEREVCFYREVAPSVSLRTPRCWFAAIDKDSGHSLLLLEDLSASRSGDDLAGCPTREAELVLRCMASFHAEWWESPALSQWIWLTGYADESVDRRERFGRNWPLFKERFAGLVSARGLSAAEQALRHVHDIYRALAACPATFAHGDLTLDNIRFDLPDAPLALFDWQLAMRAPAARDVASLLFRSMPVRQRQAEEDHLLRVYCAALAEAGVRDYSLERLRRDLNLGLLYSVLFVISGAVNGNHRGERGRQKIRARIERSFAGLEDHDLQEFLG